MINPETQKNAAEAGLLLVESGGRLILRRRQGDGNEEVCVDFSGMISRIRQSNLERELIIKAAGRRENWKNAAHVKPVILDATAGMGEDSFLLAAAGFEVELYEKDPVIGVLLADGLRRAGDIPELAGVAGRMRLHMEDSIEVMRRLAAGRMRLHMEDSFEAMRRLATGGNRTVVGMHPDEEGSASQQVTWEQNQSVGLYSGPEMENEKPCLPVGVPDVIYLDPMFPERQKSAKVKKKFQLLHNLEKPCENEAELLEAAAALKPRRIVIKRPVKGAYLAGRKPDFSYSGKAVRYDVLINL